MTGFGHHRRELRARFQRQIGMSTLRALILLAGFALLVTACGEDGVAETTSSSTSVVATTSPVATPDPGSVPSERFEIEGTVLEKEGRGPQLCSVTRSSFPPQCDGLPLVGLDWSAVPWAETAGDTTWASIHLVGTFDGRAFTLTESPLESTGSRRLFELADFTTPCPGPEGGWTVSAPSADADFHRAMIHAEAQPDFAGLWVDDLLDNSGREDDEHDAATFIVNFTFTGDLERHRSELRAIYGGPSCVSEGVRSLAEMREVQHEVFDRLASAEAENAGIYGRFGMVGGVNQFRGVVEVSVLVAIGDDMQRWLDEEFGAGLVEVRSALRPVG